MDKSNLKLEQTYIIDNEHVTLENSQVHYELYINKECDKLYIVDKQSKNVKNIITADCNQNFGYLEVE